VIGPQYVYDLAKQKLGDQLDTWLVTPHPDLTEHDRTPHGLIDSGCPGCVSRIRDLLEEMP
jgi:hypothetical protein